MTVASIKRWALGCSIKDVDKMQHYVNEFKVFELDMTKFPKRGLLDKVDKIESAGNQLGAIHLPYHDSELDYGLSFVGEIAKFSVRVLVFHLCYPKTELELEQQLCSVAEVAERHAVHVAIENLADRKNKSHGFMAAKDPIALAHAVKETGSELLGITIDTSHAICNQVRWWGDSAVAEMLLHVHLSGGAWGVDAHTSVETKPISDQLGYLWTLLSDCPFSGMVSLENNMFETALESLRYLRSMPEAQSTLKM
jgi:hypothetical protein